MQRKIDRFSQYLEYKGITENKATVECGLSVGLIGQAKRGKCDLGDKAVEKIVKKYQDLSHVWLLTGEGSMLKESKKNAQALSSVDGEVMGVIKISPQNDDTTFKNSDDMEINQLLAAILQHGADLRAQNEELRKQGERLDRILDMISPREAEAVVRVSQSQTELRASPHQSTGLMVSTL